MILLSSSVRRRDSGAFVATTQGTALLSGLIAIIVLVGWYARLPLLTRVSPAFVAMQFNTALTLFLVSLAMFVSAGTYARWSWLPALIALSIGVPTLIEHIAGRTLGVDLLLFRLGVDQKAMGWLTQFRQPSPGRMAQNTALSLTLLALALSSGRIAPRNRAIAVSRVVCCLIAAVLGFVAATSYVLGIPTEYGWGNLTRMAVHTALAVTACGIGSAASVAVGAMRAGISVRRWGPLAVGAIGIALSLSLWQALADDDRRHVERDVQRQAQGNALELGVSLRQRGTLATALASEETSGYSDAAAWAREARRARILFPDVLGLGRTSNGVTTWWMDAAPPREVVQKIPRTYADGPPRLSAPYSTSAGDRRVIISATRSGTIFLIVSVPRLAESELHISQTNETTLAITDGAQGVLRVGESNARWARSAEARRLVEVLGRTWDIRVRPTDGSIHSATSTVPAVFLVTALLASMLAALTVGVLQRERTQSAALAETATALAAERDAVLAANQAKSAFLARMSHELRTPLNSVIGFANVLATKRKEQLSGADIVLVGRIRANGLHLLSLINQVLDLAKIEAGHETVEIAPTDVVGLAEHVVASFDGRAPMAGVTLALELHGNIPLVDTDGTKLTQVLINLIGNAYKFTPAPGAITVRIDGGNAPFIEVQDTGIGIPLERQSAVFEAFEQADAQISQTYGGTGLGLAISRELCALMGHTLTLRSASGQGSTFRVGFAPTRSGAVTERDGVPVHYVAAA